jgi:DNA-binding beta-propeller fold protein YncE
LTLQLLEHSHTFGAGIAVSPTLPYGIVELADGSCQQFNTDTLSFTSIMPPLSSGGTGWYYMNMLPDQTCIAVNYLDHFVWKVDIVNLKVLKTLNMQQSFDFNAIAIGPLYDAHNPNANVYAYIPTLFNIEVINCQTMQHVRAINLDPSNIVGIAISNVLPYAFVLGTDRDNNENAVVVIDLRTNTVTQKIPNGDVNAIAISPDGYSVFVVNESTVSVLRLK